MKDSEKESIKLHRAKLQTFSDICILIFFNKKNIYQKELKSFRLKRSSPNICLTGCTVAPAVNIVVKTVSPRVQNIELLPVVANE